MKKIIYTVGDATKPKGAGSKIIAHVCNDIGAWGRGFVLAISKLSPVPECSFREWYRGRERNDFALGAVQFVSVSPDIEVANMIGQHGIRALQDMPPIRYDAVETALKTVGEKAQMENASVHLPRIGCRQRGRQMERNRTAYRTSRLARSMCRFLFMICRKYLSVFRDSARQTIDSKN